MATRRSEYPQDSSIGARLQCMMAAISASRQLLKTIEMFRDRIDLPDDVGRIFADQLSEARESIDLAGRAISGHDGE